MKRGKQTNGELDDLSRRLIKAGRVTEEEIERIVANDGLYAGVLARVASQNVPAAAATRGWAWKPGPTAAAAASALVILSVPFLLLLKYSGNVSSVALNDRRVPPVYTVESDPKTFVPDVPAVLAPSNDRPRAVHAVMTRQPEIVPPQPPQQRPRKINAPPVEVPEAAFHPIGSVERAEDAAIDGRVVRVEMPRAALFAMGVDVPLENVSRSIKADLLVGSDGSPRAIRFVE